MLFLVPYILLYLVAWLFSVPVDTLRAVFVVLHAANFCWFSYRLIQNFTKISRSEWLFWISLILFFFLPGAYLEYPSDPWEHYRRIFNWNRCEQIGDHYTAEKFAYFWAWSILSWLPISLRTTGVDFYGAFTQLCVAVHALRFSRQLGFTKGWDYLQTFAFFCLFGTNLFGMRYYALSSTPFAYAGYFVFLTYLHGTLLERKKESALLLFSSLLIMSTNHRQTLLFALLGLVAILLSRWFQRGSLVELRKKLLVLVCVFGLSIIFGFLIRHFFPGTFIGHQITIDKTSLFGTFRIWKKVFNIHETLGIHGLVGLLFALIYFRKLTFLACLSFIPIAALLFPPLVIFMARTFQVDVPYRLLYAGPTSFILVAGMQRLLGGKKSSLLKALALVIVLGFLYIYPFRGRLFFQIYQPSSIRSLKPLKETVLWMSHSPYRDKKCFFLSDDITMFILDSELSPPFINELFSRIPPISLLFGMKDAEALKSDIDHRNEHGPLPVCGLLLAKTYEIPRVSSSLISKASGHWPDHFGDIRYRSNSKAYEWGELFIKRYAWRKIEVPPFYTMFTPPEN